MKADSAHRQNRTQGRKKRHRAHQFLERQSDIGCDRLADQYGEGDYEDNPTNRGKRTAGRNAKRRDATERGSKQRASHVANSRAENGKQVLALRDSRGCNGQQWLRKALTFV